MNIFKFNSITVAVAVGLAFSCGAMAENMSKDMYKTAGDNISSKYKLAKSACSSLSGNANDICMEEAKGQEKVAKAELEAGYRPSAKADYKVLVAKAEAEYAVADERCDDKAGTAKDICVKEAKAAKTEAKSNAKAALKTNDANAEAKGKSTEARNEAGKKSAEAKNDAAAETLDAQYGVAKERCDEYAGAAKDHCLNQAKLKFNKQ